MAPSPTNHMHRGAAPAGELEPVAERVLAADGIDVDDLDRLVLAASRRGDGPGAAAALVRLDADRHASWFLLGHAGLRSEAGASAIGAPTPALAHRWRVGRLAAAVEAGDHEALGREAFADRAAVQRLVETAPGRVLGGAIIAGVAATAPRWAASLLAAMPAPPAGSAATVAAVRLSIEGVIGREPSAEPVLVELEAALARWAASTPAVAVADRADLEREAAALALLRVTAHRRRGDFVGAAALLGSGLSERLAARERAQLAVERALVAVEAPNPAELRFPVTAEERAATGARLRPAARHVERALADDPGQPVAHLLAGVRARCDRDARAAAEHLGRALAGLPAGELPPPAVADVRLHVALAHLELADLEPDGGDLPAIGAALDAGARASPELLVEAARALEARDRPEEAADLRARAEVLAGDSDVR